MGSLIIIREGINLIIKMHIKVIEVDILIKVKYMVEVEVEVIKIMREEVVNL